MTLHHNGFPKFVNIYSMYVNRLSLGTSEHDSLLSMLLWESGSYQSCVRTSRGQMWRPSAAVRRSKHSSWVSSLHARGITAVQCMKKDRARGWKSKVQVILLWEQSTSFAWGQLSWSLMIWLVLSTNCKQTGLNEVSRKVIHTDLCYSVQGSSFIDENPNISNQNFLP